MLCVWVVLILVGGGDLVMGAARTAIATGNWNAPTTWAGGNIPIAGDNIIINAGVTLTVNVNTPLLTTVVINGSGTANGITISGTNTLNCSAITMNSPTAAVNSTIAVGTGTLNASSIAINGGAAAGRNCIVSVSTGTINLSGGITAATLAQSQLTFTGSGTLNIAGTLANLTFTPSTSTVNFNGSTPQNIQNVSPNTFNFSTLKINNAAGVTQGFDAKANTVIIGDVTPNSIFNQTNLFEPTGAAGSGTLTMVSGTWNCGTASNGCTFPKYGTYNLSAGTTIGYVAGVAQAVSVTPPYVNLLISGASTKTPDTGTLTVGGNLTINSGATLDLITHNNPLTVSGSVNNSGTLNSGDYTVTTSIGGNFTQSGTATTNITSNCSIGGNLNVGAGTIFAAGDPFSGHTPWLSVTGNTIVSGELDCNHGAKDFNGDVTVNSGGIFTKKDGLNSFYTFSGNITNNGTFNIKNLSSLSAVTFDGAGKSFSGANPIIVTNAIITGSYTNSGTFTITNYLDGNPSPFTGSGTFTQTLTGVLNIGGTSTVSTLNATATGNTVNYTGASQTVQAVNYSNLTLSGSGTDVLQSGTTSVNGNLTLSGTVAATTAANMTIGGSLLIGTGTALTSGNSLNLGVGGNWTNNGSFTNNNGTVIFNGSGAQTIGGTSSTTFNNLSLSGTGAKGIPGGTSIAGNLSIWTGALANLSNGINVPVGSLTMGGFNKINGTWGSTISPATHKDNIYYSSTTGIVTVTNDTRPTPIFSGITANQSICFGTASVTLSGIVSAAGPIYPADGDIVSVTINGNTQNATISGGVGGYTINFPTAVIPASGTPYVITYSYPGDVNLKPISNNSTTLTVNALPVSPTPVNNSRCGTGTVTLSATPAASETIDWYAASSGGTPLLSGNVSYTTPSISATTIYYAEARNTTTGCKSAARTSVTATVNAIPTITLTTPASRCGTGTLTIGATASAGTINWYDALSGGSLLGTGTSFTTPSLTSTTTYYAEASDIGCVSATRTAVTATVNSLPTVSSASVSPTSVCVSGQVTFSATPSSGTITWYDAATNGNVVTVLNPTISTTTTYYAEASDNGCVSATRMAVTATVNTPPIIATIPDQTDCKANGVEFTASYSASGTVNYQWKSSTNGGTSWSNITGASGSSSSSPITLSLSNIGVSGLNVNQTLYQIIISDTNGCSTTSNSALLTVNSITSITGSTTSTLCEGQSISFTASTVGVAPLSFQWVKHTSPGIWSDVPGATTQTLNFANISLAEAGEYKVRAIFPITIPNNNNSTTCTETNDNITRILVVNPLSTSTAGGPDTNCQSATPSAITLTGASIGGSATTGEWSITNLTPANGGVNGTLSPLGPTASPETVTYTPPANYAGIVTLTLTSNGPCGPVTATRIITINPLPTTSAIYHR